MIEWLYLHLNRTSIGHRHHVSISGDPQTRVPHVQANIFFILIMLSEIADAGSPEDGGWHENIPTSYQVPVEAERSETSFSHGG